MKSKCPFTMLAVGLMSLFVIWLHRGTPKVELREPRGGEGVRPPVAGTDALWHIAILIATSGDSMR